MDINSMKNIVVLKNLPSNMIEEAFVVLKDNVKIHKTELVDKKINKKAGENQKTKNKDYVIKEAELIVSEYISKIEKKEYNNVYSNKKLKDKYKRLKALTTFLGMFSILSLFLILLK